MHWAGFLIYIHDMSNINITMPSLSSFYNNFMSNLKTIFNDLN